MTKKMYAQLLLREEWLRKREEILERDGYRCVKCEATKLLQVHHIKYGNGFP
jgi:5-methylcytosine-specific restriction endonuclease McrA